MPQDPQAQASWIVLPEIVETPPPKHAAKMSRGGEADLPTRIYPEQKEDSPARARPKEAQPTPDVPNVPAVRKASGFARRWANYPKKDGPLPQGKPDDTSSLSSIGSLQTQVKDTSPVGPCQKSARIAVEPTKLYPEHDDSVRRDLSRNLTNDGPWYQDGPLSSGRASVPEPPQPSPLDSKVPPSVEPPLHVPVLPEQSGQSPPDVPPSQPQDGNIPQGKPHEFAPPPPPTDPPPIVI